MYIYIHICIYKYIYVCMFIECMFSHSPCVSTCCCYYYKCESSSY